MKRVLFLLSIIFLLQGCAESVALLGTSVGGASSGKVVQSSLNSVISYGIKQQTGKTPLGHALAYAEQKNPQKKREKCISFIEKTRSEFCTILKKQVSLTNVAVKEKSLTIVNKYSKTFNAVNLKETIKLKDRNAKEATPKIIFLIKQSPRKLAIALQAKNREISKNKNTQNLLKR